MKPHNHTHPASQTRLPRILGLTFVALLFCLPSVMAQGTFVWDGGGADGNWTTAANWLPDGAPGSPQAYLNFTNSVRLGNTNNFAAGSAGFQIYFKTNSGAFTLFGNSITFYDFSAVDPNIQNESAVTTQTINFPIVNGNGNGANGILNINLNSGTAQGPLVFNGTLTSADAGKAVRAINISGTNSVTFNNVISDFSSSGKIALTQLGTGTTTLNGTNTFTGDLTISTGAVAVANSGQLGGGSYAGNISDAGGFTYNSSLAQTLSGVISGGGTINKTNSGTLTLSGNNTFTNTLTFGAGTLIARHTSALGTTAAAGTVTFAGSSGTPTLDIQTDGSDAAKNINIGSAAIGSTLAPDVLTGTVGINHTLGTLSIGNATLNVIKGSNVLSGSPSITFGNVNLSAGVAGTAILNPTTADLSLGSVTIGLNNAAKTLQLDGTSTNSTITGIIANGLNTVTITKANASTWTLSGANTYTGQTTVSGGRLNLTGSASMTGGMDVAGGGRLTLSGTFGTSVVNAVHHIGTSAGKGTLNIQAGVALNRLNMFIGDNSAGDGAVYQSGGDVILSQTSVDTLRIGSAASGKGYYKLSGGSLTLNEIGIGASLNDTVGVMDITGGVVTNTGYLAIARGGATSSGVLTVSGGTFFYGTTAATGPLDLGFGGTSGATAVLNVGGGAGAAAVTGASSTTGTSTFAGKGLNMASANVAGTLSVVNVLANGVLTVSDVTAANANPSVLFHFNGGTLKATAPNNLGAAFMTSANIDAVYVFGGNGTIDNNGTAITVSRPLLAPTSSGVTAIAVSGGSGYIGVPLVKITGGTGGGATAIANMVDDGGGTNYFKVGSFTITSPGVYTVAPTTVTLSGGGAVVASTPGAITTAANTSGGMSFSGAGTTTISSASSTYTGNVNINQGTLAVTAANNNGAPTSSGLGNPAVAHTVTVNNATLNLSGGDNMGSTTFTPAITLVVTNGGTVSNLNTFFTSLGPVNLNGGTLAGAGGAAAGYQTFFLRGTVTVGGVVASTISTVGSFPGIHLLNPITFNVADVTGNSSTDLTVAGQLRNQTDTQGGAAGGVTKTGAGTMLLTGANAYTGNTIISGGTIKLSGSGSISTSPSITVSNSATLDVSAISFTLGASQTLKGNGTIAGNIATASGSSILPGASPGTLTFSGNLDLTSGSTTFEVNTNYSIGNDQIVVTGNLTLNSSSTIHISALNGALNLDTNADYVLFAVSGTTTMATAPILIWDGTTPGNYLNYTVVQSGNNVVLRYTAATAPTLGAVASPASAARNQPFTITALVTNGSGSTVSVAVDLSQVGGSSTSSLVLSNNNIWTNSFIVSAGTSTGNKSFTFTATDNTSPTPLTGGYVFTPFAVMANSQTWDGGSTADDNATSGTNWVADFAPGLVGDSMIFAGTTRLTPNLDTNYTVSSVTFSNNSGSFNIGSANSSVLTLDTAGALTVSSGVTSDQTISAGLGLSSAANATETVANNSSSLLTISGNVTANVASGNGVLNVPGSGNTTVTGSITKPGAGSEALLKTGTGKLTLSNGSTWSGTGAASGGFGGPLIAREGTTLLSGGTAHTVNGELVVGGVVANGGAGQNAQVVVDGSTLNVTGYLSVGRGNGVGAVSSDLVATNAAVITSANSSFGYNGGNGANLPKGSVTLNNNSSYTITGNGVLNLAESSGSDITVTLNNTAQLVAAGTGTKWLGQFGKGTVNLNDTSSMQLGNATIYVGYRSGTGVVSVASGATLGGGGDFRVGGSDVSGTGNNGYGTVNSSGTVNVGSLTVARGNDFQNGVAGEVNITGGTFTCTNDTVLGFAGTGRGKLNINGGTYNVGTTALKWLIMPFYDTTTAELDITNGNLNLNSGGSIKFTIGNTSTAGTPNTVNQAGGSVTFYNDFATTVGGGGNIDLQLSGAATVTNTYNLNGGTLTVPQIASTLTTGTRVFNFNGGTLKPAASTNNFISLGAGNARANVRNGGAIIDSNGKDITIAQALVHSDVSGDSATDGGLTKTGSGTLALNGINTYTGITTVSNGTLGGTGSVVGTVVVVSGATLAPGTSIGTLAGGNGATLGGTFLVEINRTNAQTADKFNATGGTVTFGGTLTVTNIGQSLVVGDTFDLFDGTLSGSFSTLNLPFGTVHWLTGDLNVGGTIAFTNNNPVSQNITAGVVHGGTVTLTVIGGKNSATDADSDNIAVTAIGAPTSGTNSFGASNVTYVASGSTGTNTFTYTVTDALGATDTKTVTVIVTDPQGYNQVSAGVDGGNAVLSYLGIPGTNYALEITHDLPATNWVPVITNPAAANGYLYFTNPISLSPTNDYYRTRFAP